MSLDTAGKEIRIDFHEKCNFKRDDVIKIKFSDFLSEEKIQRSQTSTNEKQTSVCESQTSKLEINKNHASQPSTNEGKLSTSGNQSFTSGNVRESCSKKY